MLTIRRDQLSKAQTITVAAIERRVAALAEARDILAEFQTLIRRKALPELDNWLGRAARSLLPVANGVAIGILKGEERVTEVRLGLKVAQMCLLPLP